MSYTPDVWVIVEIKNKTNGKRIHKLLSGWYGGFAKGDSWRINSGITDISPAKDNPDVLEVKGHSGSVYYCHASSQKTSGLTASILRQMEEEAEKSGIYEVNVVPASKAAVDIMAPGELE